MLPSVWLILSDVCEIPPARLLMVCLTFRMRPVSSPAMMKLPKGVRAPSSELNTSSGKLTMEFSRGKLPMELS